MKTLTIFTFFVLTFLSSLIFSNIPDNQSPYSNSAPVQSIFMQTNNINTVFRTDGIFNYDLVSFPGGDAGLIWPVTTPVRQTMDFATGLWIGAKVGGQLRLAAALYGSHYSPGNIPVVGQVPPSSVCSDPDWRGYIVNLLDPSLVNGGVRIKNAGGRSYTITYDSWVNWPVSKGAPYVEVNGTPGYQPAFGSDRPGIGHTTATPDEISFMVYMDYTNCTNNIHQSALSLPGGTLPLGVEVQQLAFSFSLPDYNNMYFVKWKIINRSLQTWDSVYVGLVDDADVGDGTDDAAGCDSTKDLGYIYNFDNSDPIYGSAPPAIGYRILQSPLKFTGSNNDTARLPYGNFIGYKLTGMSGYNIFTNGGGQCTGDPSDAPTAYNFLRGRDGCGNYLFNWVNGWQTRYKYSGNPCSSPPVAWFDSTANDRRQILSMGPITMSSQSEQFIVAGCIVAKGNTNNQSVCMLLDNSVVAKQFYNNSFGGTPLGVNTISTEIPKAFSLYQNYPNPFNPVTKIKFDIPKSGNVKLTIYDALGKEVKNIVNELLKTGTFEAEWDASSYPSGVYFYKLQTDGFIQTKKMVLIK